MLRRVILIGVAAVLVTAAPVGAVADITIADFSFSPTATTATEGEVVRWQNTGGFLHSTTGDAPLNLWTIDVPIGADRSRPFKHAGTYPFHCRIHFQMTGRVRVPLQASDTSVAQNEVVTIFASTVAAPGGFRYQIQRRSPSASGFSTWKTISTRSTTFKSSVTGSWRFRSRLVRTSNGASSGWSPTLTVNVAA